ncbi:MAG: class I SAM-dependent methyltransferase [Rickettsiales bacterium]|jgi:cyclopropane fatty-acyl-phospholipid synthase-like methyltransferase|nr:class I SAM-dependent methyltransferase [Rickettsiales bacterium]
MKFNLYLLTLAGFVLGSSGCTNRNRAEIMYAKEVFDKKWANTEDEKPNSFTQKVIQNNSQGTAKTIIDVGAGDGRDTGVFVENGMIVTVVETSASGIAKIRKKFPQSVTIIDSDMRNVDYGREKYGHIYSYSSIHYLSVGDRRVLLKKFYESLQNRGFLYVACRSTSDPMASKGEIVGENTRIFNGVARTFLSLEQLSRELREAGFDIVFADEIQSKYHETKKEPESIFARVIAQKKK